jgi:hypothetical protein
VNNMAARHMTGRWLVSLCVLSNGKLPVVDELYRTEEGKVCGAVSSSGTTEENTECQS